MIKTIIIMLMFTSFQVIANSSKLVLLVEGMNCVSCASSIEAQLKKVPEVGKIDISINMGRVTVISKNHTKLMPEIIKKAIERAGYKIKSSETK